MLDNEELRRLIDSEAEQKEKVVVSFRVERRFAERMKQLAQDGGISQATLLTMMIDKADITPAVLCWK